MVICVVRITGTVAVKYLWEKRKCTDVGLIGPSNRHKYPSLLMHWWVGSSNSSTLLWFNEVRIIRIINLGEAKFAIDIKGGD